MPGWRVNSQEAGKRARVGFPQRQSGVPNIQWKADKTCWCLSMTQAGKRTQTHFFVRPLVDQGLDKDDKRQDKRSTVRGVRLVKGTATIH